MSPIPARTSATSSERPVRLPPRPLPPPHTATSTWIRPCRPAVAPCEPPDHVQMPRPSTRESHPTLAPEPLCTYTALFHTCQHVPKQPRLFGMSRPIPYTRGHWHFYGITLRYHLMSFRDLSSSRISQHFSVCPHSTVMSHGAGRCSADLLVSLPY